MEDNKKVEFFNGFDDDILSPEDFTEEEEEKEETEAGKTEEENSKTETSTSTETEEGKTEKGKEESEKGKTESEESDEEAKAKAEAAEKNAKFAEMRRQKEAKEKAEKERLAREAKIKEDAKVEAELGVITTNPYTDKPIKDESDLKIYKMQKQLEAEGRDPVADLPSKLAEMERESRAKEKAEADRKAQEEKELVEQAKREADELREKHPTLNTRELANDPLWQEVSKPYLGRLSMNEIYELVYLPKKDNAKAKENEKTEEVDEHGKKVTKVPSSKSNGGKTSKGYLDMSDEEYLAQEKENNKDFF